MKIKHLLHLLWLMLVWWKLQTPHTWSDLIWSAASSSWWSCARSNFCRQYMHRVLGGVGILECNTSTSSQRRAIHDIAVVVAETLKHQVIQWSRGGEGAASHMDVAQLTSRVHTQVHDLHRVCRDAIAVAAQALGYAQVRHRAQGHGSSQLPV